MKSRMAVKNLDGKTILDIKENQVEHCYLLAFNKTIKYLIFNVFCLYMPSLEYDYYVRSQNCPCSALLGNYASLKGPVLLYH